MESVLTENNDRDQDIEDHKMAMVETIVLIALALYAATTCGFSFYATDFVRASAVPGQIITFWGCILTGIITLVACVVACHTAARAMGKSENELSVLAPWLQLAHPEKDLLQCFAAWIGHLTGLVVGLWISAAALYGGWEYPQRGAIFLLAGGLAFLCFIWVFLMVGASVMRGRA